MTDLALALWILVAPLDEPGVWDWKIVGGPYETRAACERHRWFRLDATICVRLK